jgi:hypothetical protein
MTPYDRVNELGLALMTPAVPLPDCVPYVLGILPLPVRSGAARTRRSRTYRQGRRRDRSRGGLRACPPDRTQTALGNARGTGRPGTRIASCEAPRHGERRAVLYGAPARHQRCVGPLRRGVRSCRPPRSVGGRDVLAAGQQHGRDRWDPGKPAKATQPLRTTMKRAPR